MRRLFLIVLVLAATTSSADARHRHHRYRSFDVPSFPSTTDGFAPFEARALRRQRRDDRVQAFVPRDWQLQPPDENWRGKRFVSPDGAAWFAAYRSPVANETIAAHMKTIAFGDGEVVTYLRGERNWIVASGVKGDLIFYRKAIIACGGKSWHHVAFEYPIVMKREMDRFVIRAADAVERTEDEGCDDIPTANQNHQPASGSAAAR